MCARSKSTGDPWLTDGSYFDGSGYAEIRFESQFGTTKRFEQEIRVVSYNGIIFFLENQAGACCPGEPSPSVDSPRHAHRCSQFRCSPFRTLGRGGLWRSQGCLEQDFSAVVKIYERTGPKPPSSHLVGAGGAPQNLGQGSLGQAVLQGAFLACTVNPVPQHRAAD